MAFAWAVAGLHGVYSQLSHRVTPPPVLGCWVFTNHCFNLHLKSTPKLHSDGCSHFVARGLMVGTQERMRNCPAVAEGYVLNDLSSVLY